MIPRGLHEKYANEANILSPKIYSMYAMFLRDRVKQRSQRISYEFISYYRSIDARTYMLLPHPVWANSPKGPSLGTNWSLSCVSEKLHGFLQMVYSDVIHRRSADQQTSADIGKDKLRIWLHLSL